MRMWRIAHWKNISMSIEKLCILNVLDTTQVYTSYLDLASFSRRVSAREPCGQFWDENEKLCLALASILLGSRCPEKHSIESKPIGTIFALGTTFHSAGRTTHFWSQSIICENVRMVWWVWRTKSANLTFCFVLHTPALSGAFPCISKSVFRCFA